MSSFIYSLGLTILNLLDNDTAIITTRNLLNKEFDAVHKSFQSLVKRERSHALILFIISSMLALDPFQRPSPPLLEFIATLSLQIQVVFSAV